VGETRTVHPVATPADDRLLVAALRRGDEAAFVALVGRHQAQLMRLARTFVRDRAVAEEVVQEAWLGVLRGIDRFEGRSSLKTWIYRIVANVARTRAVREARSVPFSTLAGDDADASVDPSEFLADGRWATPVEPWQQVLDTEARAVIDAAVAALPEQQRRVIELRDVQGWPSDEVCNVLELTETNQRVLLHRARSKVRAALDDYLGDHR
jgi:RNA polymerase sigma-70 factor (ECF subfamily)